MTIPLAAVRAAVLALIACLLATVAVAVAVAAPTLRATAATGPPDLRPGLGHRDSSGDLIGFYVTRSGVKVYCLSPRKAVPVRLTMATVSRYPGLGAGASAALAYALSTWGDARSRTDAAIESQVLNTLAGNTSDVRRRAHVLPAAANRVVAAHVAEARALRGPYSVQVSTPSAVGPGRSAAGTVRVRTAAGRWLPGAVVSLRHTRNVTTPATVRTDARGTGRFRYSVTDAGRVTVTAAARALPATTARVSSPRAGEQRMASPGVRSAASATSSFQVAPGGFTHRYECTTNCQGRPALTLSACAPASSLASRIVYRVGRRVVVTDFPASRGRQCRSTTTAGQDTERVGAVWQYRTARGWSAAVTAPGTFVVDCPAPPPVGVTMCAGCVNGTVTFGLAQPGSGGSWLPFVNTSRNRMMLTVSGARNASVVATTGREALWTTSVACGSRLQLTARASVQRADGRWNQGTAVGVVTP